MSIVSRLSRNQADVRHVAQAIASVLGVEVTIVDDTLRRIAGTGRYAGTVGDKLDGNSAFAKVLRDGKGFIISNPREHIACITCEGKSDCSECAEVCCPILLDNKIIGIIALIAFDERQRQALLSNQDGLLDFLQRMSELLASKVAEQERIVQLKNIQQQMTTVLNTVQEGIIAVGRNGQIVDLNTSAAKMLHLDKESLLGADLAQLISGLAIDSVLDTGHDVNNREVFRLINGRRVHYIVSVKPWLDDGEVRGAVATLRELSEVRKFVSHLSTQVHCYTFGMILGNSPALMRVKQEAAQAAAGTATVLIRGESGTGKEMFARAIHCTGERQEKPFIAINCAAIPEALLESELFGYEEGAFSGARRGGKPGKFELAEGGTIFLDEIGDMSLTLQSKLLRVLQERQIDRVGGTESSPIDVRIIAATHKDIEAMVQSGAFRQDLYYRINVFPLQIPPLRQRREDLPLLIQSFLAKYRRALQKDIDMIEETAYACLLNYEWPGNIRELENTMEYLVNIATENKIEGNHLPERMRIASAVPMKLSVEANSPLIISIAELEKAAILGAIKKFGPTTQGKARVALALGISKATLYRKLKEYDGTAENVSK
ncbi:MAG: Fis family transcriptional regulator [Firmicutes bacterium]|nr:Fis family transcriptional regulator [Bacillota bacterium]